MSEKKRGASMSDDERALIGRERRITPVSGVPIHPPEDDDFTPVTDMLARMDEQRVVLTERERMLVRMFWQHTANMEMRARKRSDSTETATLRREIDALQESIIEIAGKSGNNGRVGVLKERMDKAEARRWWAITFIAGLVITIVGAAFSFGSRIGALESDVKTLRQRARNGSPPDYPAIKEGSP